MQNVWRLSITLVLCWLGHAALAQEYFYIGEQRYPAVYVGSFSFPGSFLYQEPSSSFETSSFIDRSAPSLSVRVAKRSGGGWLVLSTYCGIPYARFSGNVYLYLSDGSVIKCYDRGLKDYINNRAVGVYMLSAAEVARLKQHSIDSIRFTIDGKSYIATGSEDTRQPIRELFGN